MNKRLHSLLSALALFSAAAGCSQESPTPDTSSSVDPTPVDQPAEEELEIYDEDGIPVRAQYPETMQVMGAGSGEGVGVFFSFKPRADALDEAEVHVFLPFGAASAAEQEPFVTGPNGLLASNGWVEGQVHEGPHAQFPYEWVEKVIDFSTGRGQSGHILLGQTSAQAVQVTLIYPVEMADAYWPVATTILRTLRFDESQLPLRPSSDRLPEPGALIQPAEL